jgi:hypothetical protein
MTCQPRESRPHWGFTPQALDITGVFEPEAAMEAEVAAPALRPARPRQLGREPQITINR